MKIWLASTMIVSVRPILFFRSKATQYPFRKEDDSEINHGGRGRDFERSCAPPTTIRGCAIPAPAGGVLPKFAGLRKPSQINSLSCLLDF
jgi:hypothetical protein